MTYKQALDYINSLECLGIRFGLSNVKKVSGFLGKPEKSFRSIHIAGTNGKGSVAVMLDNVLREAGFITGLYTSPHLIDLTERIQVNGRRISKRELARLAGTVRGAVKKLSLKLTYFEFLTVIAFLFFALKEVDIAVLETGMGGRLDATNVIENPLVSVITNIDYEHMDYLGSTLESIAGEKAGIIKKKGTVVTGVRNGRALEVIKKVCKEKEAKLFCAGKDISARILRTDNGFQEFSYKGIYSAYGGLRIKLRGEHQVWNTALAVGAIEVLRSKEVPVSEESIRKGLAGSAWPGRLELLKIKAGGKRVRIILDGAHNPSGIVSLGDFLRGKYICYDDLILVFGSLEDKDFKLMASGIVPLADRVVIVSPKVKRALNRSMLRDEVLKYARGNNVYDSRTVSEGLRKAIELSGSKSLVCIAGSLYVIGEAKRALKRWV